MKKYFIMIKIMITAEFIFREPESLLTRFRFFRREWESLYGGQRKSWKSF
jgi:hypothetical protein